MPGVAGDVKIVDYGNQERVFLGTKSCINAG